MPMHANALAVMAKAPIPGKVKTRMVPPLTHEQAAQLFQVLLLDQLEHLTALEDVDLYVAFTPVEAKTLIKGIVPANFQCFHQRGHDLGERMYEVFAELWRRGHRNLVLIGGDLPVVPFLFLRDAFKVLQREDRQLVFGPSEDGGYYLVGMNQPTPEIFQEMSWSHDQVLKQTTEKVTRLGIDFGLLPGWFDLDTIKDLERLRAKADPAIRAAMKRTVDYLRRLGLDHGLEPA
jgi:rSAM/selenodomain-associated transferase 1